MLQVHILPWSRWAQSSEAVISLHVSSLAANARTGISKQLASRDSRLARSHSRRPHVSALEQRAVIGAVRAVAIACRILQLL